MSIREKNQMVSVLALAPLFISATQRTDPQSMRKYCIMIFLLLKYLLLQKFFFITSIRGGEVEGMGVGV